jgi:5-methylcytosine-specific restriction endonuclease McrA
MTKEEKREYDLAYHKTHKCELAAKKKAYRETHKAEIAAKKKSHYEANKAKKVAYYQAHKAEFAARRKAWGDANHDKTRAYAAKRRALERGAFVEYVDPKLIYVRDGGRCHICGKKVPKKNWHLDHLIPLARGGEHSYKNVAVACPGCNMRKHTKAEAQLRLI